MKYRTELELIKLYDNIHSKMTMYPTPGSMPFALSVDEEKMTPEEWAWQFLRLSGDYRKDYEFTKNSGLCRKKSDRYFDESPIHPRNNQSDHATIEEQTKTQEKICRIKYGLSTWLNPDINVKSNIAQHSLPKIDNDSLGLSWFFPLSDLIFDIDNALPLYSEEIFGYAPPHPDIRIIPKQKPQECSSTIVFVIDCSCPIESKLNTAKNLCKIYRRELEKFQGTINRPTKEYLDKVWCYPETPGTTFGQNIKSNTKRKYFRTFWVDLLGPYDKKLEQFAVKLHREYKCIAKEIDEQNKFPLRRENHNEKGYSDGNPYKQMLVVKQLMDSGFLKEEISILLRSKKFCYPKGSGGNWSSALPERIDKSADDANHYISGAYRWFVHTQYKAPINSL